MTKKGKHTVLFICLGNICRSPAGEGIMKSLVEKAGLENEFEIDSAGIGNWHVGQLPDSRMRKCGAEHGYNFNSHARQFQKSDFGRFETIVVMDNENYRAITSMASCQADKDKVVRMADHRARSILRRLQRLRARYHAPGRCLPGIAGKHRRRIRIIQ